MTDYFSYVFYGISCCSTFMICGRFNNIFQNNLKEPDLINSQKDSKIRTKQFLVYHANWISLFHAVIMLIFSYPIGTNNWDISRQNNFRDNIFFSFSLGYYLWDTIYGIQAGKLTKAMLFHHILMFFMIFYVITLKDYNFLFITMYFVGEFVNPIYILYVNFGFHSSLKNISNILGVIFSISFLIIRVYYCGKLAYQGMALVDAPLVFKIFLGFGYYISLKLSFFVFNKFIKGVKDITGFTIFDFIYLNILKIRKMMYFNHVFETLLLNISLLPLFFLKHNRIIN